MFDIIIIGSGPGGITSAIYASRSNLNVGIIEKNAPGGAIINTKTIENYPGYEKIDGVSLALNMFSQIQKPNVKFISDDVKEIIPYDEYFEVIGKKTYYSKTVVIAIGTTYNKLSLQDEEKFIGHGISFCALCDASLYKGKDVAVVGGGSSALQEALYLSTIVNKVYLIHRRDSFRAEDILVSKVKEKENIELIMSSEVSKYQGNNYIESIVVCHKDTNENKVINLSAVFLYIGSHVDDTFLKKLDIINEKGYITTNDYMETKIKNLFAVGDCRDKEIRQIVTATSDGAIAASIIKKVLE